LLAFALGFLPSLRFVARLQLVRAAWLQVSEVRAKTSLPALTLLDILTVLFEIGAARFLQLDLGIGGDAEQGASSKRGQDSERVHRFFFLYPKVIFIPKRRLDFCRYNPFRWGSDPRPFKRLPSCVE
jgi:hypothetical protein